jgi:hypothetical protein
MSHEGNWTSRRSPLFKTDIRFLSNNLLRIFRSVFQTKVVNEIPHATWYRGHLQPLSCRSRLPSCNTDN